MSTTSNPTPTMPAPGALEAMRAAVHLLEAMAGATDRELRKLAGYSAERIALRAAIATEEAQQAQQRADSASARRALEDIEERLSALQRMANAQCMDPVFHRAVDEELRHDVDALRSVRFTYHPEEKPR